MPENGRPSGGGPIKVDFEDRKSRLRFLLGGDGWKLTDKEVRAKMADLERVLEDGGGEYRKSKVAADWREEVKERERVARARKFKKPDWLEKDDFRAVGRLWKREWYWLHWIEDEGDKAEAVRLVGEYREVERKAEECEKRARELWQEVGQEYSEGGLDEKEREMEEMRKEYLRYDLKMGRVEKKFEGLRWRYDKAFRMMNLYIKDKESKRITKFAFNRAQKKLWAVIMKRLLQGRPVRLIVLKSRQWGCSTLTSAIAYDEASRNDNVESLVVAHLRSTSKNLLGICKRFLEKDEATAHERRNDDEIQFSNGSKIWIGTAVTCTTGRGTTINFFHGSEVAFWPNAETLWGGLAASIPDAPDTYVIFESTANGVGGFFYDMYQRAKDPASASEFDAVFIGWPDDPTCWREFESEAVKATFIASMSEEERAIQETYQLKLQQMYWRRTKIHTAYNGDVTLFRQEYPLNDEEAFLTTGISAFNKVILDDLMKTVPLPVFRGEIGLTSKSKWEKTYGDDNPESVKAPFVREIRRPHGEYGVRRVASTAGSFIMFENPGGQTQLTDKMGMSFDYVIGVDVAEGISSGARGVAKVRNEAADKRDYSVVQVLKRPVTVESPLVQVAVWRGRVSPYELAGIVCAIAKLYRIAYVGVENNSIGSVVNTILHEILRYPRLHVREEMQAVIGSDRTMKYGWLTSHTTKPYLVEDLAQLIEQGRIKINDKVTIGECLRFQNLGQGKYSAPAGTHDDAVMALGVGVQMHMAAPVGPGRSAIVLTQLEKRLEELKTWRKEAAQKGGTMRCLPLDEVEK